MAGTSVNLGQSANWRDLFEGFSPLARVLNWLPVPMQKGVFLGFSVGDVFRGMKVHVQGNAMKVFSGYITAHRSQNKPSNVRDGEW